MHQHILLLSIVSVLSVCPPTSADWARFRGPNGSGISEMAVPQEFSADKNMKWKLQLPGPGVSSPIVVGDKVFVTCYSGYGGDLGENIEDLKRHLVCVDRESGEILWDKTVKASMPEDPWNGAGVPSHGYASHTPTSDGKHVFAFFGKSGVVAFDMEGNQKWQVDVGKESGRQRWGSSSSPILYGDTVIVTASDESEALVALDKSTGKEKWKQEAEMLDSVWGTPALAKGPAGDEVVIAVPGEVWGLSAETGKFLWYAAGNDGASHSVVVADDVAYSIGGGRGGSNGVAVKVGGKDEVEELVWENNASGRFATPLVYNDRVYTVSRGIVACFNAKDGKKVYEERLPRTTRSSSGAAEESERRPGRERTGRERGDRDRTGGGERGGRERGGRGGGRRGGFGGMEYASPIIAGGDIYIATNSGTVFVVPATDEFKVAVTNDLTFDTSGFNATPAASDGQLFLRSNKNLYCIAE